MTNFAQKQALTCKGHLYLHVPVEIKGAFGRWAQMRTWVRYKKSLLFDFKGRKVCWE